MNADERGQEPEKQIARRMQNMSLAIREFQSAFVRARPRPD